MAGTSLTGSKASGRSRRLLVNAVVALVSAGGTLLIGEMALHFWFYVTVGRVLGTPVEHTVRDRELGYVFIPNSSYTARTPEFTHHVSINSFGLRDVEYPRGYFAQHFVILGLGDSFAWGAGVEGEDGFLAVAERVLNTNGRHVRIIKAGMPGYDPIGAIQLGRKYIVGKLQLRFDIGAITFKPGDIDSLLDGGTPRLAERSQRPASRLARFGFRLEAGDGLIGTIKANSLVYQRVISVKGMKRLLRPWLGTVPHYCRRVNEREGAVIQNIVNEAVSFSSSRPFVFVLIPQHGNLIYDCYPDAFRVATELMLSRGIRTIDTYARLRTEDPQRLYYSVDQHMTKFGYRVVGEYLAQKLVEMNLVGR